MLKEGEYIFEVEDEVVYLTPYSDRYNRIKIAGDQGQLLISRAVCARMIGLIDAFPCNMIIVLEDCGEINFYWSNF